MEPKPIANRLLPSSKNSYFQKETKRKTFLAKMSIICTRIKKIVFILMHSHLAEFWNKGSGLLGEDLLHVLMHRRFKSVPFYLFVGRCNETLAILTHIFREFDIVPTKAEDQVRCVAQVDAVFNGLEKEWKSLQVKINSSSPLIAELSPAHWSTIGKKIWFSMPPRILVLTKSFVHTSTHSY